MTDITLDDLCQAVVAEIGKNTTQVKRVADALEAIAGSLEHKAYVAEGALGAPTAPAGTNRPANMMRVPGIELKMEWKPFKDKPGHWAFSKSNPLLRDTLLAAPNKTLEHGGFKYRLSGEQDMFLQRFPAGGAKT